MPQIALSLRRIFSLWWPLAASQLFMSAEMPFVSSGIARTANPEVALAGFGLAFSLAIFTEAPILMLIGTATALAKDRASFKVIERFTIYLGFFTIAVHFLLAFTPLYDVVVRQLMGVPGPVADACLPALRILILWPAPIGWRRFHQGVLIRLRRTRLIGYGTVVRLAVTVLLTLTTLFVLGLPGQVGAATAVASAVLVESALVSLAARRVVAARWADTQAGPGDAEPHERPLTYAGLIQFYLPLAVVSIITIVAQPIISTGLARAPFPTESLAVWPTLAGLAMLISSLCQPLQETTIALADGHDALPSIRRFGLAVGFGASAVLALMALTPLSEVYFGQLIGLPPHLRSFVYSAAFLMAGYPLLMAIETMLRGVLIRQQRTPAIRAAMGVYVLVLGVSLAAGTALGLGTGVQIAAVALNLALVAEICLLAWQAMPVVREMRRAVAAV